MTLLSKLTPDGISHAVRWRVAHVRGRWEVARARFELERRWRLRRTRPHHGLPMPVIVSLTSYPPRYPTLALTLKSLLTQATRPDRVVLWIAHDDVARLPESVLALREDGLDIQATADVRSYKKIIPALVAFPEAVIVTADDDVYYDAHWLARMIEGWNRTSAQIVCHRAHRIRRDARGVPLPYRQWEMDATAADDADDLFPTGVGGVLYPPGALHPDVVDADRFMALCPRADDVWLYWMGRRHGARYKVVPGLRPLVCWDGSQEVALCRDNLFGDGNDPQIARMVETYGTV